MDLRKARFLHEAHAEAAARAAYANWFTRHRPFPGRVVHTATVIITRHLIARELKKYESMRAEEIAGWFRKLKTDGLMDDLSARCGVYLVRLFLGDTITPAQRVFLDVVEAESRRGSGPSQGLC
jgi:hypothetical protein